MGLPFRSLPSPPLAHLLCPGQMNSGSVLAKPSIRFRKTINAVDWRGRTVGVNAQQYAVLITNVNQRLYEHTR